MILKIWNFILMVSLSLELTVYAKNREKDRMKTWYEFEYSQSYKKPSLFEQRSTEAVDLYKEYKDSIYVDRYYNSSFALNIPLFTLTLPGQGRGVHSQPVNGPAINIGNFAMLGLIILASIALVSPLIFPESKKRSFQTNFNIRSINQFLDNQFKEISESVIGRTLKTEETHSIFFFLEKHFEVISEAIVNSIDKSIEDLPYFPRKKLQQCMNWCICDVHKRHKKYGFIGILFRAIFPHKSKAEDSSEAMTKYHLAANYGREGKGRCGEKFIGCSISVLEIVQEVNYFIFNKSKSGAKSQNHFILQLIQTYLAFQ